MAPGTGTGVWVIRKQTRRKRPGQEDEITVHSTYFVMGENIYMAPAVGDVIGSRLVSSLHYAASHNTNNPSSQFSTPSISLSPPHLRFQTSPPLWVTPTYLLPKLPVPKRPNPNSPKQAKKPHPCPTLSLPLAPKKPSPPQPTQAPTPPHASSVNPLTLPSATPTNTWTKTLLLGTQATSTFLPPAARGEKI